MRGLLSGVPMGLARINALVIAMGRGPSVGREARAEGVSVRGMRTARSRRAGEDGRTR